MILFSHRGHSVRHPDNSMEGFREAIAAGADGIETDVRQTSDGALVLFHDRILTDGRHVSDVSLPQLRKATGYHVPTLSEALDLSRDVRWLIELKTPDVAAPITRLFKQKHPGPRVMLISFWHHLAHEVSAATDVAYGITMGHSPRHESLRSMLEHLSAADADAVIWNFEFLDAHTVQQTLDAGCDCLTYSVCDRQDFQLCRKWSVSGIIADDLMIADRPQVKKVGSKSDDSPTG